MRSRKAANEHVAQVARRRLELLTAELAQVSRTLPLGSAGGSPPDATAPRATPPTASATINRVTERGPVGLERIESLLAESAPAESAPAESAPRLRATVRGGRHARRSVGFAGRVGGWVHDRLPPTLQGSVGLTSTHLTVVALVVAAALGVASWWVVRGEGGQIVAPATARPMSDQASPLDVVPAGESASAVALEDSSETQSAVVVIDVAGKVRRPGIVTLPIGSRVVDAIKAAGGARKGVSLTVLNLARLLIDGEQILVGIPPPTGVAAPAASAVGGSAVGSTAALVNLNSATETDLDTLPGVGPVTAAAILQWRTDNGAFSSVDELLEVSGIGDATLADIAPFVTI